MLMLRLVIFVSALTLFVQYCDGKFVSYRVQTPKRGVDSPKQYWTKEKREAATPYHLKIDSTEHYTDGQVMVPDEVLKHARAFARKRSVGAEPHAKVLPDEGTHYVSTNLFSTSPYSSAGKVFFVDAVTKKDFVCSGSIVGENIIMTAGHCVAGGKDKGWHLQWSFSPQYYSGGEVWEAEQYHAFKAWYYHGNLTRDVAFVTLRPYLGKNIGERFPVLKLITQLGHAPGKPMSAIGYPVAFQGGDQMVETFNHTVCFTDCIQPPLFVGLHSHLSSGASGGPWVYNVSIGSSESTENFANGVNSFSIVTKDHLQLPFMYSPYFDIDVQHLYDNVRYNRTMTPSEIVSGPVAEAPGFWNEFYQSTWFWVMISVAALLVVILLILSVIMSYRGNVVKTDTKKDEQEPLLSRS
mmetsp:Transcript_20618/g.22901  ORF Transcript_20618/g.22901 Transcript_20618/m.22901 type:complete len:409 (-) Transcript_20618:70-1296(-)